jgi:hypothetical protein
MAYLLERRGNYYFSITNCDSNCALGWVFSNGGMYHVETDDEEFVVTVRTLDEALPALLAYYEKNPPQWKYKSATRYTKWTEFGDLRVEQESPEQWLAYRTDCPLLRTGNPAIFASPEEAQRVADVHYREGYPNSEIIFDGFAWLPDPDPWWSYPHRVVALRGKLAA